MIRLRINLQNNIEIPNGIDFDEWLIQTVTKINQNEDSPHRNIREGTLELNFVDAADIHKLNKEYRDKDKATDVLSFSFLGQENFPRDNVVGQVFLAPEIAKKQAEEHDVSWKNEIEFLFVHSLLHVFGFDHETKADFIRMYDLHLQIMPDPKWQRFADQVFQESFGKP